MTWLVLGVIVLHAVGIGWGLPASDGWDNDGVAPRDFLPGLAETFTPGHFYTYPPVHLAILALFTLPIVLLGAARAPTPALPDIVNELLKPGYMTAIAVTARLVSLLMSVGIALFAARIVEELRAVQLGIEPAARVRVSRLTHVLEGDFDDPRVRGAGYWAVVFVGTERALTYYAHTTNVDVPYLFWGMVALAGVVQVIARNEPRRLRCVLAVAVLAVGTKDQAYALFGLALPIALGAWIILDERHRLRALLREAAVALALAVGLFLVVDAVVFNPAGAVARFRFLTGSASQDFVEYTRDWSGRLGVLGDAVRYFDAQYPWPLGILGLGGLALLGRDAVRAKERRGARLALALLPGLVAVSFTLLFNWVSLRTNARFLMPQALMLALYAAIAADELWASPKRVLCILSRIALGVLVLVAVHGSVAVDANLVFDPRYEAEAWLRDHVKPGETIETYGLNVYLPRFPEGARVIRVGPEPLEGRNPLPGVTEVRDGYERASARDARYIVLSSAWAWRYLLTESADLGAGRRLAPTQQRTIEDATAARWFYRLTMSEDAFQFVLGADYQYRRWLPVYQIHGTTGAAIWIYERKPGR